ncbi:MAG: NAD(P)/FAD-dependent oxidoreductase [Sandaracinaceae bacterium]
METTHDVVICGGGLAGLTFARQLSREQPDLRVALIEPSVRPLPEAAHKVGESTVEVGTRYLGTTLGLKPYLDSQHLPKNGLRFFSGDNRGPFQDRVEFGPFEFPPVPSYQLDRGKLENDLRAMLEEETTIELREGQKVDAIELGGHDEAHRVTISGDAGEETLTTRWVVDASGRRHLLRRQLDLSAPSRILANSSWWRVPEKIDVAELVPESETRWHTRDNHKNRWLSTNHLTGPGYWVWVIPLQNDHTSIGIVAETAHHPFETINTLERSYAWLKEHEPHLHARLEGVEVVDFLVRKQYSYSGKQFLSTDRWAAIGEAAFFTDPLYSQGTDYITFANTYTARAIAEERQGKLDPEMVSFANEFMLALFRANEDILSRSGEVFRYPDVFGAKLLWDYYYYWAYMAAWYFYGVPQMNLARQRRFLAMGNEYARISRYIQETVRAWAELRRFDGWKERTHVGLPDTLSVITDLHMQLDVQKDADAAEARMAADLEGAKEFAAEVLYRALVGVGRENAPELARRIGLRDWDLPLDATRIGLQEGSRNARRDGYSRVARDLERLLGHPPGNGTPLSTLVEQALGHPVEASVSATAHA